MIKLHPYSNKIFVTYFSSGSGYVSRSKKIIDRIFIVLIHLTNSATHFSCSKEDDAFQLATYMASDDNDNESESIEALNSLSPQLLIERMELQESFGELMHQQMDQTPIANEINSASDTSLLDFPLESSRNQVMVTDLHVTVNICKLKMNSSTCTNSDINLCTEDRSNDLENQMDQDCKTTEETSFNIMPDTSSALCISKDK